MDNLQTVIEALNLPTELWKAVTEVTRLLTEKGHDPSRVFRRLLTYLEDSLIIGEPDSDFDLEACMRYALALEPIAVAIETMQEG